MNQKYFLQLVCIYLRTKILRSKENRTAFLYLDSLHTVLNILIITLLATKSIPATDKDMVTGSLMALSSRNR